MRVGLSFATMMLVIAPISSNAAVINFADVGGFETFQDTNTGRVWLDLNNFFNETATVGTTGFDMITAAQAGGFQFAARADVVELFSGLPLGSGEWAGYAAVMGHGVPRQLIWGMYDDSDGNYFGYAYAYSNDTGWNLANNVTDANFVQNAGASGAVDMGLWGFREGNSIASVPEPGTLALFELGLLGMRFARRKN